jgi:hypothetical protein
MNLRPSWANKTLPQKENKQKTVQVKVGTKNNEHGTEHKRYSKILRQ